ncbi:MAG TPA: hypothetical protein VHF22_00710 [Planctomycetota bacterium]|nr:hypothetical protein [Planctomycetota bacterium]
MKTATALRSTRRRSARLAAALHCVLCGRREWLVTTRCEVTGEPVTTCANVDACLDRFHGPEGQAFRVAQALAGLRADRRAQEAANA